MSASRFLSRLRRHRSGVAMTEFALGAPFILMAGLWGTEEANFALVNMKVGQLAVHIADNASRIGDTSTLEDRKIYESDINDLIYGAQIQAGAGLNLYANGRVIISSLANIDPSGGTDEYQHIQWQRCRGAMPVSSSYGTTGQSMPSGMGPAAAKVIASPGEAVIFVELVYTYQPLISERFVGRPAIRSIASFIVRDDRDLTQIYQRDPADPDPVQGCGTYSGAIALNPDGSFSTVPSNPWSSSTSTTSGGTSTTTTTTTGGATTSTGGATSSTSGGATSGGATSTTTTGGATSSTTSGGATSTTTTSGGGTSSTTTSTTSSTTTTSGGGGGSGGRGGGRGRP